MGLDLDLASARRIAEEALVDLGRLLRDPEGTRDQILDRSTNRLTAPVDDELEVYEGPGLLSQRRQDRRDQEGEGTAYRRVFQLRIPIDAPKIRPRDIWLVLRSPRRHLVGRRFRVYDIGLNSVSTTQLVLVEDETGALAR